MKILVLGVTGMAGHTIALYLQSKSYQVVGLSQKPFKHCDNIICDVFETNKLSDIITNDDFVVVINCLGILNQSAELEKAKAIYINSYIPHFIADLLKTKPTKFIHMSTDCVFAGNTGPYNENSTPDGTSYYDRTKALGEVIDSKNLTFRNSILGPDMKEDGIGLLNWFMKQEGEVKGYKKAIWTGVTTLTLAKAIDVAINQNLTGLYHLVNNISISKYELLNLFNQQFKSNSIRILEDDHFVLDKSLVNNRTDFPFQVPSYEEMVVEMKNWIQQYSKLYPHYSIN